MTNTANAPRRTPCPSCPYRCDVPSGVWEESEYDKLLDYDGEIFEQASRGAVRLFFCHQQDGRLCAGWVGYRDPYDLLALRLAISDGRVDSAVLDYRATVPLFSSGAVAAEHGKREIECPDEHAREVIDKVVRLQERRS